MGFPQDATIIEEDNQACVYASEIPHMTRGKASRFSRVADQRESGGQGDKTTEGYFSR